VELDKLLFMSAFVPGTSAKYAYLRFSQEEAALRVQRVFRC
jgi:hypothetical protein